MIKLRKMLWARHVARMGKKSNIYSVFMEKTEGKRPLGRTRCWWEDNIKMDLTEMCDVMDWIHLTQDRDRR
jgi:hypothetical protein